MKEYTVYQTLQDKENPDEVERCGPYPCDWDNTWLGTGYYFWEAFEENAHWWGKKHCKNKYMIGSAIIELNDENCIDLYNNTDHMISFEKSIILMKKKKLIDDTTTVNRVLQYLRYKTDTFKYSAVRAEGTNSKLRDPNFIFTMKFENKSTATQFLDYKPAIQICAYDLSKLNFVAWRLIYPPKYTYDDSVFV